MHSQRPQQHSHFCEARHSELNGKLEKQNLELGPETAIQERLRVRHGRQDLGS